MNTTITRIGFLLIPAALALALTPAAAMADELQNGASSTNSGYAEQTQERLAGKASTGNEPTPKNESPEKAAETTTPGSPSNASSSEPAEAAKNGLVLENGHLINYSNGIEATISGWRDFEGSWYWFANSSKATESKWVKTGGKQYRLGADGKMITGNFSVGSALYHATSSGAIVTGNKWVKADGKWWFPNKNGSLRTGWVSSGGSWYWLNTKTGAMATGWVKVDGKWYLLNSSGAMLTGWQKQGAWYYLTSSGAMKTGWLSNGGKWYWLNLDSGAMQTGWIKDDNGKWWFADGSGALASARWVQGAGGSWYRVDSNGAMATGWRQVSGKWYWMDSAQDGKMAANKLVDDNGAFYWCNSSGAMIRNDWCKDSTWHWASGSGAMSSGWLKTGGSWYWLDPSDPKHPMLTGLQTIDGSDYFFKNLGAMASTCWVKVDAAGNARFASSSGALGNITRDADGTLKNNGVLCSGWVNLGSGMKTYADPKTHKAKTGWIKEGSVYYYINPSSGVMATGWQKIGGTWYYFDGSGVWVPNPERAQMTDRIWGCNSGTQWLIAVNRSTHKVGIYRGSSRNWSLQYYVDCVTGAPSSPTITGTFRTSGGKRMALSTDSRAKWCTQISGGYFFHTILASNNELGKSLSHGCIRMAYPDAQWIYNNVYAGTTVVIYG